MELPQTLSRHFLADLVNSESTREGRKGFFLEKDALDGRELGILRDHSVKQRMNLDSCDVVSRGTTPLRSV